MLERWQWQAATVVNRGHCLQLLKVTILHELIYYLDGNPSDCIQQRGQELLCGLEAVLLKASLVISLISTLNCSGIGCVYTPPKMLLLPKTQLRYLVRVSKGLRIVRCSEGYIEALSASVTPHVWGRVWEPAFGDSRIHISYELEMDTTSATWGPQASSRGPWYSGRAPGFSYNSIV